jgi:hypothetical protein
MRRIALQGIGYDNMSIISQGFNWIEVIIIPPSTPVPSYFGGGGSTSAGNIAIAYGYVPYHRKDTIVFRIKQAGREWEEEYENVPDLSYLFDTSNDVSSFFIGIRPIVATSNFIGSMINTKNISIKVRKL